MTFWNFIYFSLQVLAALFVIAVGLLVLAFIVLFFIDRLQTRDAVRRNYPVLGRFRHIFSELGEFFRQYFFAMDREELPFNRAQREWIERSAHKEGNTVAFGSTRNITLPGTPIFVNAPFPPLDKDYARTAPFRIGPHCRTPYDAPSFFNISGMSFGALSKPAVKALSRGASPSVTRYLIFSIRIIVVFVPSSFPFINLLSSWRGTSCGTLHHPSS